MAGLKTSHIVWTVPGSLGATCYVVAYDAKTEVKEWATILQAAGYPVWVCDGTADEVEINAALTASDSVSLSEGTFLLSDVVRRAGNTALKLVGAGAGVTIIGQTTADKDCFEFGTSGTHTHSSWNVGGFTLTTVAGTGSGMKLTLIHRSHIYDINSPGCGAYLLKLYGCILNTFTSVVASNNIVDITAGGTAFIGVFGTGGCYMAANSGTYCNANTFVGCSMEGCPIGYDIATQALEGDNTFIGGTIEGCSTYGMRAYSCRAMNLIGINTEVAGSNIYLSGCIDCTVQGCVATGVELVDCQNCKVTGGNIDATSIDADCEFCQVEDCRYTSVLNLSPSSNVVNLISTSNQQYIDFGVTHDRGTRIEDNGSLEVWTDPTVPDDFVNMAPVGTTLTKTGTGLGDTTKYDGSYAILIAKTGAANEYKGLYFNVPAGYGTQWINVECMIKLVAGSDGPFLGVWYPSTGNYTVSLEASGTSWQKVQFRFYYTINSSARVLFSTAYTPAAASFYMDKVRIWASEG